MTDYTVAIDLGTSHLAGVVGKRHSDGKFSIVAYDTEDPSSCIRRGNIDKRNDAVKHIKSLIDNLEYKLRGDSDLKDAKIEKVYIGVGGQSLRTKEHAELKEIEDIVTDDDVNLLKKQCETYTPDVSLDVLDIAPPIFYLDGRRELKPEGISCRRLEASYKLIVGRPSIRREISNTVAKTQTEIAGIVVSPLSLADAMLSREEKELGCALVDFGAGVTTVTVYKSGELLNLSVIPLGSNLITKDITTQQFTEAEAEKLKKEKGSAIVPKDDGNEKIKLERDGLMSEITVTISDLDKIIEARIIEIIENVMYRIKEAVEIKSLGSGIVLAGCAANLNGLQELMKEKCKVNVRFSAIRSGLVTGNDEIAGDPLYMTAVSVMLKGTEQCVEIPVIEQIPIVGDDVSSPTPTPSPTQTPPATPPKKKKKWFAGLDKMKSIFDEQ
jgi:cell division protein FtsA